MGKNITLLVWVLTILNKDGLWIMGYEAGFVDSQRVTVKRL